MKTETKKGKTRKQETVQDMTTDADDTKSKILAMRLLHVILVGIQPILCMHLTQRTGAWQLICTTDTTAYQSINEIYSI